ncbi:MAG: uracil-DNA glycosylase [Patescibacteria group bacterium]
MTPENSTPVDDMATRRELMKKIKDEVVNLEGSPLYKERIANGAHPVIGEGDHFAKIMFVGEAPGKNESETGRPFCGASGRILDELLASLGVARKSVYVTNVVKDRPTQNRDPLPDEIALYAPFLVRQIGIIQPKVIATLGRFSMDYIMKKFGLEFELGPISKIHGKVFKADAPFGRIKIVPLYHPAVALYNGGTKNVLLEDFKVLTTLV